MIKVYEFCGCDLVVTNKSIKETMDWYSKEYQYVNEKYVEEIDGYDTYIKIKDDNNEFKSISVKDYIVKIDEKDMPMIIASSEY